MTSEQAQNEWVRWFLVFIDPARQSEWEAAQVHMAALKAVAG